MVIASNWGSQGDSFFCNWHGDIVLNQMKFNKSLLDVVVTPPTIYLDSLNEILYSDVQVGA